MALAVLTSQDEQDPATLGANPITPITVPRASWRKQWKTSFLL